MIFSVVSRLASDLTERSPSGSQADMRIFPLESSVDVRRSPLYSEWQSLFAGDPEHDSFQHPDYVLQDRAAYPQSSRLKACVVTARVNLQLIALGVLLPKSVSTSTVTGLRPGWGLHGYRLAGNRFLTLRGTTAEQSELLQFTMKQVGRSGAAFLMIEDLDERSPLFTVVNQCLTQGCYRFTPQRFQPRLRIELPSTADEYWSKFSSKTRYNFRRNLRLAGESRLIRVTEPDQVTRFLEDAQTISRQTWQTRQFGLRVQNDERQQQLFTVLAEKGLLRSYLWMISEAPAAFAIGNQSAGCFRYEEVGYLPEFAKISPGQTLLVQILDDLFVHHCPNQFDFGGGDADYKRLFANQISQSGTVWLVPPSYRMQATLAYLNGSLAVKRYARELVKKVGLTSTLRRWIRQGHGPQSLGTSQKSSDE